MKKLSSTLVLLFFVMSVAPAGYAQTKAGIGIGLNSSSITSTFSESFDVVPIANIYVPVIVNNFRVEPEIGLVRAAFKNGDFKSTATMVRAGIGLFGINRLTENTQAYFGVRGGAILIFTDVSAGFGGDGSDSRTDFFVGPALGGEHFFGDHFSLGAEAQVNFLIIGNFQDEVGNQNLISTNGVFFVRWYFNR